MKNIKRFPRIVIFLLLLSYIPLHAAPDPCELQRVADEIRQSLLKNCIGRVDEIQHAIWNVPDGVFPYGLKQFFPKECDRFRVEGAFEPGFYVYGLRTWFVYKDFPFLCVFMMTTYGESSLRRIVLFSADARFQKVLWMLDFPLSSGDESCISN